ncbi:MAG: hypothetical protein WCK32_08940 [Chlorobiaceae bacterium]
MANLSLYVSGQAEHRDIAEFFQKGLMNAGENPIAFFDGVFYESHQERVGNIAFQDYLIYTDKAVYLWARGSAKDYLDRFDLGTVSVNSRNKDNDFATINLKIRREDKEPVYVIFDMVELCEAEQITRLHTVIESIIEEHLGLNFRKHLPDNVSVAIINGARNVCVPQMITLRFETPDPTQQESHIGYGQDLLEQYKATIGYPPADQQEQPRVSYSGSPHGIDRGSTGGFSPADALNGLGNMLPTDPASLKRIAESIKEMIGDAPFKLRDQVRSDLQHVPGMITALNELLASIADNPQAERFIMNIIKTAVRNDGVIGSVGKLIKLSSSFGGAQKNKTQKSSPNAGGFNNDSSKNDRGTFFDNEPTTRRRKIKIDSDDTCFGNELSIEKPPNASVPSDVKNCSFDGFDDDTTTKRKTISITTQEESPLSIVKQMTYTKSIPNAGTPKIYEESGKEANATRKKVKILPEGEKLNVEITTNVMTEELSDPDKIAVDFANLNVSEHFKDERNKPSDD